MDLRYISWKALLLYIQLLGASLGYESLPKIERKLLVGRDRELPGATPIQCGTEKKKDVFLKESYKPSDILTSKFEKNAFTVTPVNLPNPTTIYGPQEKFTFGKVCKVRKLSCSEQSKRYVLQVDKENGERAYWLRKGGHIMIPRFPQKNDPKFVFTPDFDGSSLTVTLSCSGHLHLRHVEGGKEDTDFNNLKDKGGYNTYALQYKDYGYTTGKAKREHLKFSGKSGFAYMHFSNSKEGWTLHLQSKGCAGDIASWPKSFKYEANMKIISKNYTIPQHPGECPKKSNTF